MIRAPFVLTKYDEDSLNLLQESNGISIDEFKQNEWFKCRENPFYFILNYVYLPEVGGKLKYTKEYLHPKFRRVIKSIYKNHMAMLMASRQLGKSSIAACLLAWALIFFPNNRVVILNYRKIAAQENLKKIKFIIQNLPGWMRIPYRSKSEIKEYAELQNGSRIDTFYPSSTSSPSTLARSLTVPILYVDEVAFISHMEEIYGSAQQTLSNAREQAIKNSYPYFIFMTSTPNGVEGDGKFFYDFWMNAVESDDLFVEDPETGVEDWIPNTNDVLNQPDKNSFTRVKYHWSENPDKTIAWYEQQKKELNFDLRKINQELDILFVGGTNCIFSDEVLQKLAFIPRANYMELSNQVQFDMYDEIDPQDYYLLGVDTASSIKGAFNALELFSYRDFNQVGEANVRLGSLTKYGETVDSLFRKIYQTTPRIILCIENNSIGKAVIEHLIYHVKDFNYMPFIYKEKDPDMIEKHEFGISTTGKSKELMVSLFYDHINQNPQCLKSQNLIAQLATIQRSNRGTIKASGFSDMFMSGSFCAYVRNRTYLDILPLLGQSNKQVQDTFFNSVKTAAEMMNVKLIIKNSQQQETGFMSVQEDTYRDEDAKHESDKILDEDWRIFIPIMTP